MSDQENQAKGECALPKKRVRQKSSNIEEVTGHCVAISHDRRADRSLTETGTIIKNLTDSLFEQLPPEGMEGWGQIVIGEEVRGNSIYGGDGWKGRVFMKDDPSVTGNTINAGFKETGLGHSVAKAIGDVKYAAGLEPLKLERKTLVLQGNREDYEFRFNNDRLPERGYFADSVDITHIPTGAKNKFVNFDYVVFGGKERVQLPNYVELSTIRAEEEAKAAVKKTRGQIAPASETAPQQFSSAKGDSHQR